jgi:hypothetical protein
MIQACEKFQFWEKSMNYNKKVLVKDRVKEASFMLKKKKMSKYGNYNISRFLRHLNWSASTSLSANKVVMAISLFFSLRHLLSVLHVLSAFIALHQLVSKGKSWSRAWSSSRHSCLPCSMAGDVFSFGTLLPVFRPSLIKKKTNFRHIQGNPEGSGCKVLYE